ncbi:MAG: Ig-like domain-containing protein [bacterium]
MKLFILFVFIVYTVSNVVQATTITVNSVDINLIADDGICTLYEAVDAANNNTASGQMAGECPAGENSPTIDVIDFSPSILPAFFSPFTPLELTESVHISGPDKDLVTFSSAGIGRSFIIANFALFDQNFKISDVSFVNNSVQPPIGSYGGAIYASLISGSRFVLKRVNFTGNQTTAGGGALALSGGSNSLDNLVQIIDCYFSDNFAQSFNETVFGGGAIFIGAGFNVEVLNSSFVNNFTFNPALAQPQSDASGGAILLRSSSPLQSTLLVENSTFSGNTATGVGGAIAVGGPGYPLEVSQLTVKHSTITQNVADSNDDVLNLSAGGGIWSSSSNTITLRNSIVALNVDHSNMPANDLSGLILSNGYNFIGDNSNISTVFPAGQPNINNEWVGVPFVNLDPVLEPLADNGARIPTHKPAFDSLVLDQGKCTAQLTDQAYQHNPATNLRAIDLSTVSNNTGSDGCDVGAIEFNAISEDLPPMAENDDYQILEGQTMIIDSNSGLLANDTDSDSTTLVVLSAGEHSITEPDIPGQLKIDSIGALEFTPDDIDSFGSFTFEYQVSDHYSIDSAFLTVNTLPVNDPPSFTPGTQIIHALPGDVVHIPGWATQISRGPANENDQNLIFLIDVLPASGYFSTAPVVNAQTGDLNFILSNNATGIAQMSVQLKDSGGTANGGIDTSSSLTIQVEVPDDTLFEDGFE